jgi:hypothetical protein
MARNRTPTAILDAKGAYLINPQRERGHEPTSNKSIGAPPKCLSPDEKKTWKLLLKQSLPGVLMESDTTLFLLLVRLTTKLYKNEPMMVGEMSQLISLGAKFAMSPADRSKVSVDKPKESSLSAFLNRKSASKSEDILQ